MTIGLQRLLLLIVLSVAGADGIWAGVRHFDIDVGAYLTLAVLSSGLAAGGIFYSTVRRDERLSAMLLGAAFLIAFSASFSLLNYFLLTVAGPRVDAPLAAIDRAMGIDWPGMMALASAHPFVDRLLEFSYNSVLPQIVLLIAWLAAHRRSEEIYKFCVALAIAAAITVFFWTAFPSFGAFSVYQLPANVSSRLTVALDSQYARDLVQLLANGPGHISPQQVKGLIGFPSFHAVLALLVVWYAWPLTRLRWPIAALNAVVLIGTPIQGGHHVIDVLAGFAVAAASVVVANALAKRAAVLSHPLRPVTAGARMQPTQ